ncbi:MAG: hypothetical protein J0J01_27835 [Reyranella sp.]|uniref:hypothetical protein n=1 Tax=Reyranella sp. TaxID=1929291 RepID=UPI001AC50F5E|nr:hypothetical protein [Reyranella sp.]MBN9090741.1 hypothetical protein [Reyranella sp.]
MPVRRLFLLAPLLLLAGCHKPPPSQPDRALLLEQRKDALVAQLADCESGQGAGHGRYVGRFQFEPRTVIGFVRERDGRTLSLQEAAIVANDYAQASALAKYIIFERGGASHWPACSRKIGLAQQVADIRAGS